MEVHAYQIHSTDNGCKGLDSVAVHHGSVLLAFVARETVFVDYSRLGTDNVRLGFETGIYIPINNRVSQICLFTLLYSETKSLNYQNLVRQIYPFLHHKLFFSGGKQ